MPCAFTNNARVKSGVRYNQGVNSRIRIGGAFLVGVGIILGAIFIRPAPTESTAAVVRAVEGDGVTARTYIPSADSNRDGVFDWEEEIDSVVQEVTEDLPQITLDEIGETDYSLTGTFARSFFEDYLTRSLSGSLTEENVDLFLTSTILSVERDVRDTFYTRKDIINGQDTPAAERAYGNAVAAAVQPYLDDTAESELVLLERGVLEEDDGAYQELTNIANAYERALTATLLVPTPPDFVGAHLTLVNAYQKVANNVSAMAEADTDPLHALLRIGTHEEDIATLQAAFERIYKRLHESGVRYANDEPASLFNALIP